MRKVGVVVVGSGGVDVVGSCLFFLFIYLFVFPSLF